MNWNSFYKYVLENFASFFIAGGCQKLQNINHIVVVQQVGKNKGNVRVCYRKEVLLERPVQNIYGENILN